MIWVEYERFSKFLNIYSPNVYDNMLVSPIQFICRIEWGKLLLQPFSEQLYILFPEHSSLQQFPEQSPYPFSQRNYLNRYVLPISHIDLFNWFLICISQPHKQPCYPNGYDKLLYLQIQYYYRKIWDNVILIYST